jgi:hypothetical protein
MTAGIPALADGSHDLVHEADSRRPVTGAVNGIWEDPSLVGHWEANDPVFMVLDLGAIITCGITTHSAPWDSSSKEPFKPAN